MSQPVVAEGLGDSSRAVQPAFSWAPELFATVSWTHDTEAEMQWRETVRVVLGFAPPAPVQIGALRVCATGRPAAGRGGRGHEVAIDSSAGIVVACDAWLNDRAGLQRRLGLSDSGHLGSAQLLLQAYRRWADEMFEFIVGDYAFLVADARRNRVMLGRDIFGIRPLYYVANDDRVAVSTSATPLSRLPWVGSRLDEHRLLAHFALLDDGRSRSFYAGVEKLPGEHALIVGPGLRRKWMHWQPQAIDRSRKRTLREGAEELAASFESAVADQLIGRNNPASMLSGGLDSSAITVVARDMLAGQNRPPMKVFSGVFPDLAQDHPKADESPWINKVVSTGGIEPVRVPMEGVRPWDAAELDLDEPNGHPNSYLMTEIFFTAAAHEVDLLFSGHDGDSAIGYGLGRFKELFLSLSWLELLKQLRAYVAIDPERRNLRKAFRVLVSRETIPMWMQRAWRMARGSEATVQLPRLVSPEFAKAGNYQERLQVCAQEVRDSHQVRQSLNNSYLEYGSELLARVARSHGTSCAMPFLDQRVIAVASALPERLKWDNGINRLVMREAMRDRLPESVRLRSGKQDISANVRMAIHAREIGSARELVGDSADLLRPYLRVHEVLAVIDEFIKAPMSVGTNDFYLMFQAVNLIRWRVHHGI